MRYREYVIERGADDNYRVTPPNGFRWREPLASIKTAKRLIDMDCMERASNLGSEVQR